jgi:hypothetical protein
MYDCLVLRTLYILQYHSSQGTGRSESCAKRQTVDPGLAIRFSEQVRSCKALNYHLRFPPAYVCKACQTAARIYLIDMRLPAARYENQVDSQ